MLTGIFFLHKACKSDMDALEAFLTQAKRHLSQAVSSIKYDTEICTFVNVFQMFPTDVKFVISSSIFTTSNEFRFFILIFKPYLIVYLCNLERQSWRSLRHLQSNRRSYA